MKLAKAAGFTFTEICPLVIHPARVFVAVTVYVIEELGNNKAVSNPPPTPVVGSQVKVVPGGNGNSMVSPWQMVVSPSICKLNTFTSMVGASNFGINTGLSGTKYLSRIMLGGSGVANTVFPANVMLCDYVGFYPLVDLDVVGYQAFDNTNSITRYSTGGLKVMVVCTVPQTTGSPIACIMYYRNQDNVDRVTTFYVQAANLGQLNASASSVAGTLGTASPFVPLGTGDHSILRVNAIEMANSAGGFASFVLVKPLATVHVPESITPVEIDLAIHRQPIPEILSGAYLNLLCFPCSKGTASGIVRGQFDFIQ